MKKIYEGQGIFVDVRYDEYWMGREKVINESKKYSKKWWELEQAVKGRNVLIVVYDLDEDVKDREYKIGRNDLIIKDIGDRFMIIGSKSGDIVSGKNIILRVDEYKIVLEKNNVNETIAIVKRKYEKKPKYEIDIFDNDKILINLWGD